MRQDELRAREIAAGLLGLSEEAFVQVRRMGGITNENYYLATAQEEMMLRLPGECTDLIDRAQEERNAHAAAAAGLNPKTLYFSAQSGIKITRYIPGARALNAALAAEPEMMCRTASLLRRLHRELPDFENRFDPQKLFWDYLEPHRAELSVVFENLQGACEVFSALWPALDTLGKVEYRPCHNDPLAENLVLDKDERLWLIDWEYSGQNDPFWDVAAHLLESDFDAAQQNRFLALYLGRPPEQQEYRRVLLLQIAQDLLWSVQTMAKTLAGENQFDYAKGRYDRAAQLVKRYRCRYGKLTG